MPTPRSVPVRFAERCQLAAYSGVGRSTLSHEVGNSAKIRQETELEFVLELAVAAKCEVIVTHNRQDFRGATRFGIPVVTPADFLAWLEEEA